MSKNLVIRSINLVTFGDLKNILTIRFSSSLSKIKEKKILTKTFKSFS